MLDLSNQVISNFIGVMAGVIAFGTGWLYGRVDDRRSSKSFFLWATIFFIGLFCSRMFWWEYYAGNRDIWIYQNEWIHTLIGLLPMAAGLVGMLREILVKQYQKYWPLAVTLILAVTAFLTVGLK